MHDNLLRLQKFIHDSPTAWHAVQVMQEVLNSEGYEGLEESQPWALEKGKKYWVSRNGASLCAFQIPSGELQSCRIAAAHSDSPALKLKPNGQFEESGVTVLTSEVYGGPLLNSWLNRELGIAGKIATKKKDGCLSSRLVNITDRPLVIPQLAIHLDREVNSTGLLLDRQKHLGAVAGLGKSSESCVKQCLDLEEGEELLSAELFLYPLQEPSFVGMEREFFAAYRLDNLESAHAVFRGLLQSDAPDGVMPMMMVWDHEEIGSSTTQGAGSPFLKEVLERIQLSSGASREEHFTLKARSLCLSVDMAHAQHPNYPDKHDSHHRPLLGKGPVLKLNAQQRYASEVVGSGYVKALCQEAGLDLQVFVARTDMPCGSTIGPINGAVTGIRNVDLGSPQLSMHGARELMAGQDHLAMCKLLETYFSSAQEPTF